MTGFEEQVRHFDEKLASFLLKIQTKQGFEPSLIEELNIEMNNVAVSAKAQQLLPRKLLWSFRAGTKALDAEIPYAKANADALAQLASRLEYTMDLILLGESPSDRTPGVPRII